MTHHAARQRAMPFVAGETLTAGQDPAEPAAGSVGTPGSALGRFERWKTAESPETI